VVYFFLELGAAFWLFFFFLWGGGGGGGGVIIFNVFSLKFAGNSKSRKQHFILASPPPFYFLKTP